MSKRILVVEDQPDNRQIIRDMLAPTDYEITEVERGEEALAAVAKQRPDLILMIFNCRSWTATSPLAKSRPMLQCDRDSNNRGHLLCAQRGGKEGARGGCTTTFRSPSAHVSY